MPPDTSPAAVPHDRQHPINRARYLRIVIFFSWWALQATLLYVVLQPLLGREIIRRGEERRLRHWSHQFRELAVHLGGVMIKLGQFISTRIDVLPPSIIEELAGLQDEVPPAAFEKMAATLCDNLGPDWRAHFEWLDEQTIAAASLGQAYRAQLSADERGTGERVIVKVQRPGIEQTVYTDLQALGVVGRLAMRFHYIARRADVPALLDEFGRVLWEELDYTKEADNAERFAALFEHDPYVYIPAIHRECSTRHVLVLEDVTAIKLDDYAALSAAGVDRAEVAQRLLDTYLTMVFVHRFFHADPHPGNIFIYPLPEDSAVRQTEHRPFYVVFVDFGMTGALKPAQVAGLRETLIALITRDSKRLIHSYQQLGVLLPGTDLERLEAASEAVFDQVWGLSITEIANMDVKIMAEVGREFSDLLFSMPFQVPQDFIYLGRAVGILSGMCTGLDPHFDPWGSIQPFVRRLLAEDGASPGGKRWSDLLTLEMLRTLLTPETVDLALSTGRDTLTRAANLPGKVDKVLNHLERGSLTIQVTPDPAYEQQLQRLERTGKQLVGGVVLSGLAVAGALLLGQRARTEARGPAVKHPEQ